MLFLAQCKRRFGRRNPERIRLAHWEWMVRHGGGPYGVRADLGLESNFPRCSDDGSCSAPDPDWCFHRFGMSRTTMPDGRTICIGGEHEDSYDPDFCIYNEVIVLPPKPGNPSVTLDSGEVEIYGYPASVFPPTDFHSATLVDDRIILIGRLGYPEHRRIAHTPVYALNTATYQITELSCRGDAPGWIYKHHASFDPALHAITVRGGMAVHPDEVEFRPFRAVHRLYLSDRRWEQVSPTDDFRMLRFEARTGHDFQEPEADDFKPASVPHTWLPPEDRGCDTFLLDVSGVRITFEVLYTTVRVTIEGTLSRDQTDAVLSDVLEKLNQRGATWELFEIDPNTEW